MNNELQQKTFTSVESQLLPVVTIENNIININKSDKRHNALFLFNFFIQNFSLISMNPYIDNEINEKNLNGYLIEFSYKPCFD